MPLFRNSHFIVLKLLFAQTRRDLNFHDSYSPAVVTITSAKVGLEFNYACPLHFVSELERCNVRSFLAFCNFKKVLSCPVLDDGKFSYFLFKPSLVNDYSLLSFINSCFSATIHFEYYTSAELNHLVIRSDFFHYSLHETFIFAVYNILNEFQIRALGKYLHTHVCVSISQAVFACSYVSLLIKCSTFRSLSNIYLYK